MEDLPLAGTVPRDPTLDEPTGTLDGPLRSPPASALLAPGTELDSRYVIREVLGEGGYAVVYLAWDRALKQEVALKALRGDRLDVTSRERLKREAAIARGNDSPHLVRIFDICSAGGITYLTMERVEGETLRDRLEEQGRLPVEEAVRIALEILQGLEALHRRGVVHRDIKPSNVLITPTGRVRLCDYGLARRLDPEATGLTATTAMVGTPDYLAPEQALGQAPDARTDLFSLGVVLFRMLSGQLPFEATSSLGSVLARLHRPPAKLRALRPEVPRWLARVVRRLLASDPADRYPGAAAAMAALERRRSGAFLRRRPRRQVRAAAVALVVLLGAQLLRESAELRRYRAALASSPRGLASRAAACGLCPQAVDRFLAAAAERLRQDVLDHVLPAAAAQADPFPCCTGTNSVFFVDGTSLSAKDFLERLALEYRRSGDRRFMEWFLQLARHLRLDLPPAGGRRVSDVVASAIGRFDVLFRHRGLLEDYSRGLDDERLTAAVAGLEVVAVQALLLAADQFWDRWTHPPNPVRVFNDHQLVPLLLYALEDPHLESLVHRRPPNGDSYVATLTAERPPIEASALIDLLFSSGRELCALLVKDAPGTRHHGRSFEGAWWAGGRLFRQVGPADRHFHGVGAEADQPVLAQDHAALMESLGERLSWARRVLASGAFARSRLGARIEVELGGREAATAWRDRQMAAAGDLEECFDRLDAFHRASLSPGRSAPGEYLYLPDSAALLRSPLELEALAASFYARAVALAGRREAAHPTLVDLLARSPFVGTPQPPSLPLLGWLGVLAAPESVDRPTPHQLGLLANVRTIDPMFTGIGFRADWRLVELLAPFASEPAASSATALAAARTKRGTAPAHIP